MSNRTILLGVVIYPESIEFHPRKSWNQEWNIQSTIYPLRTSSFHSINPSLCPGLAKFIRSAPGDGSTSIRHHDMTDLTLLPPKKILRGTVLQWLYLKKRHKLVKCSETFYAWSKAADYDCFSAVVWFSLHQQTWKRNFGQSSWREKTLQISNPPP